MKPILCILAGGRSSRFGSQKLWLRVQGKPMVTWMSDRLGSLCGQRWLSVAPGAALPPGAGGLDRVVADHVGFGGPLQAMLRILGAAPRGALVLFAAGDMPLVDPKLVRTMIERLRSQRDAVGVMCRWTDGPSVGRVEPLPSVWRAGRGATLIQAAIMRGLRGPTQLAKWRQVVCLPAAGGPAKRSFANINSRDDLSQFGDLRIESGGFES